MQSPNHSTTDESQHSGRCYDCCPWLQLLSSGMLAVPVVAEPAQPGEGGSSQEGSPQERAVVASSYRSSPSRDTALQAASKAGAAVWMSAASAAAKPSSSVASHCKYLEPPSAHHAYRI